MTDAQTEAAFKRFDLSKNKKNKKNKDRAKDKFQHLSFVLDLMLFAECYSEGMGMNGTSTARVTQSNSHQGERRV